MINDDLIAFLRARAAEDLASDDELRRLRGRGISALVGVPGAAGTLPAEFVPEAKSLALHYVTHPDYRQEWKP